MPLDSWSWLFNERLLDKIGGQTWHFKSKKFAQNMQRLKVSNNFWRWKVQSASVSFLSSIGMQGQAGVKWPFCPPCLSSFAPVVSWWAHTFWHGKKGNHRTSWLWMCRPTISMLRALPDAVSRWWRACCPYLKPGVFFPCAITTLFSTWLLRCRLLVVMYCF